MSSASKMVDYETGLSLLPKLLAGGQLQVAAQWADRLCSHRPDDARAHTQAGLVRHRQGHYLEAKPCLQRAAVLRPATAEIWGNLGNNARRSADFPGGLRHHRRAALCDPEVPGIRYALGVSLLSVGDVAAGFREFEHRHSRSERLAELASSGVPVWDRRLEPGLRLLVATEQGAGDAVQFLRFVRPLAERGLVVTVACPATMERLVRGVPGVAATTSHRPVDRGADFDGLELLMSLPAALGIGSAGIVAADRYIEPPGAPWTVPASDLLRVGLCWNGSPVHPRNEPRRIPFDVLRAVLSVPGVAFYSLQVGAGRAAARGHPGISDLTSHINDFADTAAMVDQMDLVITIDTSIAHIAGALGKPTWVMLPRVADWRWGENSSDTPWYRSARLFRQSQAGGWDDVVGRVVEALSALLESPGLQRTLPRTMTGMQS